MKISCIIPAYNEQDRIQGVVSAALFCKYVDEVIVVDDGSQDYTLQVLERIQHNKLTVLHQENSGKTKAFFAGLKKSTGEYILMLDADLLFITSQHLDDLIFPVISGKADITISLRENSLFIYKLLKTDFVSGERMVPRKLFGDASYYTCGPSFGLEVKMNSRILKENYKVENVYLSQVVSPRKYKKSSFLQGVKSDTKMIRDIVQSSSISEICKQIYFFSRFGQSEFEAQSTK